MGIPRAAVVPALVAVSFATAFAQDTASIGNLKVRADSPLVKNEYPRLLITRAQLPTIRARLDHPEIQTYLQQAKDLVKLGQADALLLGTLYQLTGEKQYAEDAKQKLGAPTFWPEWSFAFDLVAETMSEAERKDIARRMLDTIKAETSRPRLRLALLAWGNGIDAEVTPFLDQSYTSEVVKALAYCNRWSQGRGGSPRGHGYNGQSFFSHYFSGMLGWSHATGDDVLSKSDFADQQPVWYVYHYLPWGKNRSVLRIGVTRDPRDLGAVTPASCAGDSLVMLPITRTRNGLGQWWEREFIGKTPVPNWRRGQEHIHGLAGRLLWLDPSIPSISPTKFPETRLFPESGHVCMRSGWTEDATVALFKCGRQGKTDMRNNADNLHFIIYKQGYLAPDTGCVHWVNESVCKMLPQGLDTRSLGANEHCYAKQTIAHNAITVGREPIRQPQWAWGKPLLGNIFRGGQTTVQEKEWFAQWGIPEAPAEPFREGSIIAYQTSPDFDYICGDATRSYPPSRVKSITRQFVYLKPDTFVVFDRVLPADSKLEVIWNLHAYRRPEWNGKTEPARVGEQFIMGTDGKKAPNPEPGGHFLHTEGDTFHIANGGGVMESGTLLPTAEQRLVRTIGGKWHDFEVDGVNYGPTEATYVEFERRKGDGGLEGIGGWRIEVTPKTVEGEAHFLHVLRVGLNGKFRPAASELIRGGGAVGARVKADGRTFEVTFSAAGGHLKIVEGEKTLADEDLVTGVEDDYSRWKHDPRYNEWMNNEFMRAVIFPYGKKPD